PDIRYLLATVFQGKVLSVILLIIWLALYVWLLKERKKYNTNLIVE
ncbi:PTS galactitol transporter subunit IIC, partial [Streptococcus agalactiae]